MENDVSNVAFLHIFALKIREGGKFLIPPLSNDSEHLGDSYLI